MIKISLSLRWLQLKFHMCKSTVPLQTRSTYPGLQFFPPLFAFALAVEHVSSCRFSLNDKKNNHYENKSVGKKWKLELF